MNCNGGEQHGKNLFAQRTGLPELRREDRDGGRRASGGDKIRRESDEADFEGVDADVSSLSDSLPSVLFSIGFKLALVVMILSSW